MLSSRTAWRDLRILSLCVLAVIVAALLSLFSYRYSSLLGMMAGGFYIAYRLATLILRRFRGDAPLRLVLLALMVLAMLFGVLGFGRELFALILLFGFDFLILYGAIHRKPKKK